MCTSTVRLSRRTARLSRCAARAVVGAAVVGEAVAGEAALPDVPDEVRAAEYPGRVRGEEGQEFELLEGQRDLAAAGPDPALHMIQEQT